MVTTLVVRLGIVTHAEQADHRHQRCFVQDLLRALRHRAYLRFIAAESDASVILSESFVKPRLGARIIAVQQQVRIFVVNGLVGVGHRQIQQNEAAVFAHLK